MQPEGGHVEEALLNVPQYRLPTHLASLIPWHKPAAVGKKVAQADKTYKRAKKNMTWISKIRAQVK